MTESERSGQRAGGGFLEKLAINIRKESCTVIAFTGGGGKTDLIFRLTDELTAAGKKVIVTTTTHMAGRAGDIPLWKMEISGKSEKILISTDIPLPPAWTKKAENFAAFLKIC